jgi:hypothetical protein
MMKTLDDLPRSVDKPMLPPPSGETTAANPFADAATAPLPGWGDMGLGIAAFVLVLMNVFWLALMFFLMPRNDFGRTFLSAVAFANGGNMYGLNPSIPWNIDGDTIYLWNLNPPHFHLVLLPLVFLPQRVALFVWMLANVLCLFAGIRLIGREAKVQLTPMQRQLMIVGLLGFIGMSTAVVTGHLSFMLFYVVTLSWAAARHGRWGWAGFWLGLGLSVKPFLLFLVPYLVFKRQWRAVVSVFATVAACFALGLIVFGWENYLAWKARLTMAESWAWLPMNASFMGILSRTFTPNYIYAHLVTIPSGYLFIAWAGFCSILVPLTFLASSSETSPRGVDRAFALLPVAALLISPLGWTYYFWLPLGPLFVLALGWWRQPREANGVWPGSRRLLLWAIAGVMFPLWFLALGQPSILSTLIFGSPFFWSLLLVWIALAVDGFRQFRDERVVA